MPDARAGRQQNWKVPGPGRLRCNRQSQANDGGQARTSSVVRGETVRGHLQDSGAGSYSIPADKNPRAYTLVIRSQ